MKKAIVLTTAAVALAACASAGSQQPAASGKKEISFLVFETPNLTPEYWDAAIKRVTDKHPDIVVNKLVAPSAGERNAYAKQLLASGQLPDVMQAIAPSGLAESGNLYAWSAEELKNYSSGSLETVDSMFLQTYEDVIRVFPAWPAGRDGKFVRLRAKGAFVISAERKAGREVSSIELLSEKGGPATLASPWQKLRPVVVDTSTHRPLPLTFGKDSDTGETTFSFVTRPGRTYVVSGR